MCVCMGGGAALVVRKSNFLFIDAAAMKAKFYFENFAFGGDFVKKQPDSVKKHMVLVKAYLEISEVALSWEMVFRTWSCRTVDLKIALPAQSCITLGSQFGRDQQYM